MTLHHEAMQAEIDYRHEQARRSWTTEPRSVQSIPRRLWQTTARWARRLAGSQPTQHAPKHQATAPGPIVRVHLMCWTDGTPTARRVAESIQSAVAQHFPTPADEDGHGVSSPTEAAKAPSLAP